ncbi:MAG: hypothetical protein ACI8X3_003399 [Saprospiraceae bacterium]
MISFVSQEKINEVSAFLENTKKYKSVSELKYRGQVPNAAQD